MVAELSQEELHIARSERREDASATTARTSTR